MGRWWEGRHAVGEGGECLPSYQGAHPSSSDTPGKTLPVDNRTWTSVTS